MVGQQLRDHLPPSAHAPTCPVEGLKTKDEGQRARPWPTFNLGRTTNSRSNRLECQVVGLSPTGCCQAVWERSMAFRITKSLRMQATSATFLDFPRERSWS